VQRWLARHYRRARARVCKLLGTRRRWQGEEAEVEPDVKRTDQAPRATAALCAATVAVVVLAAANLLIPLDTDQAFFMYVAKHLKAGATLYRDIWDVKQPGIFLFYRTAGEIFGFDGVGVHLLEAGWMGLQCLVVARWATELGVAPRYRSLAPLFTVGLYYAAVWTWHLTQVEALVGLPLLVAGGLPLSSLGRPKRRLFAAGVAGGVVLVFKATLFPLLAAMWGVALVGTWKGCTGSRRRAVLEFLLSVGSGCALPLAALAIWAWLAGFLPELLFATFRFPLRFAVSESSFHFYPTFRQTSTLWLSLGWFVQRFGPLLLLAALGARTLVKRANPQAPVLFAWIVSGAAVFLAQTWWAYQLLLLLPPLGLLALAGTQWLLGLPAGYRPLKFVLLLAALAASGEPALVKLKTLASYGGAPSGAARLAYQAEIFPDWGRILEDTAFLGAPDAAAGPIYVWDGPLYGLASGRELVFPSDHAYLLPDQRIDWPAAVMRAEPAYIRLPRAGRVALNRIDPALQPFLDQHYRQVAGHSPWYARAGAAAFRTGRELDAQ
jgi:hypothetical protein